MEDVNLAEPTHDEDWRIMKHVSVLYFLKYTSAALNSVMQLS
jgi:hypothetical protein